MGLAVGQRQDVCGFYSTHNVKEFLSLVDDALDHRFNHNTVDNWELLEALPKLDIRIEEGAVDTFTLTQEEDEMKCPVTLKFEALTAKDMLALLASSSSTCRDTSD